MPSRIKRSKAFFQTGLQGSARRGTRQFTAALAAVGLSVGLAACSGGAKVEQGAIGYVEGFLGGVVADEPRAALAGRDILSAGGSAADAATAMYFTLAVTLPSRAGLAGGGMCLAFDEATGKTEALDFTARVPAIIPTGSDRPSAIPANPRGFFALQARHGRLQWREVVAPAEQLARFGHAVSRAFAQDLAAIGPALYADGGARTIFSNSAGVPAQAGDTIKQLNLAAALGLIRARGVGPFYTGPYARTLVDAVARAGGSLSIEDLRGYTPVWRDTLRVEIGSEVAHFAPPPAAASTVAAVMLAMLIEDGAFDGADEARRAQILSEMGLRAFADRETWLNAAGEASVAGQTLLDPDRIEGLLRDFAPEHRSAVGRFTLPPQDRHETPSATVFAAADPMGNAVSCAVTMNSAFGTGRVAPGTGLLLAAAPGIGGRGPIGLAPMLVSNENSHEFLFAAGASGGVTAPSALANVAARVLLGEEGLEAAIAAPRVHLSGAPDVTYHEPGLDADAVSALAAAGHRTAATPVIGQVNVLSCPDGLPAEPDTCHMAADPRGLGLAVGSMR